MALINSDRDKTTSSITGFFSDERQEIPSIRDDVFSAVVYTDNWIDTNQADWNSGLPASIQAWPVNKKRFLFAAVLLAQASIDLFGDLRLLLRFVGR